METITIVMFIILFAITALFSAFAIDLESDIMSFLAMILWFALGVVNIGLASDAIFYSMSFLYWGLGMLFMIFGIAMLFGRVTRAGRMKQEQESEKEFEIF